MSSVHGKPIGKKIITKLREWEGIEEVRISVPKGYECTSDKESKGDIIVTITRETPTQIASIETFSNGIALFTTIRNIRKGEEVLPIAGQIHVSLPTKFGGALRYSPNEFKKSP